MTPHHHAFKLAIPQPGDWNIDGPLRPNMKASNGKPIPPGKNFSKDSWPYWNHAHHLIPKALFRETIDAVDDPDCRDLIRQSLLRAEYNINHHVNVILLPQDLQAARAIGLPRHLIMEDGPDGLDANPKFGHRAYCKNVSRGLKTVIKQFKRACDRELAKKCDTSSFRLSKERLERLSAQCYASVLSHGETTPGDPISTMPPISFR